MRNRNKQYRLKAPIAKKLGLEVNKSGIYRLNKSRLAEYQKLNIITPKRLFFDIETSPNIVYSWRIGWNITITPDNIIDERKIICICWKWENEDKVYSATWDNNQCDKEALKEFIKVANEADEIVAHNGDRFDEKWIRTRALFHRLHILPKYKSLDTLKKAKTHFLFNSNKLDYIAKFLGVGAKLEHSGFDMWVQCMKGDKEALNQMVEYCKMDCIVLEDVYHQLQSYIKHNTHHGVINLGTKADCPNCSSNNNTYFKLEVTAAGTIKRIMKCNHCDTTYPISNRVFVDNISY